MPSARGHARNSPSPGWRCCAFDDHGKVVDHRDYDNHVQRREASYADWWPSASTP